VLCWDVFGVLSSRRGDDTNRRILQSCKYGLAHTGTECVVHVSMTGVVRCTDFVLAAHWCAPSHTAKPSAKWANRRLRLLAPTYRSGTASSGCRTGGMSLSFRSKMKRDAPSPTEEASTTPRRPSPPCGEHSALSHWDALIFLIGQAPQTLSERSQNRKIMPPVPVISLAERCASLFRKVKGLDRMSRP